MKMFSLYVWPMGCSRFRFIISQELGKSWDILQESCWAPRDVAVVVLSSLLEFGLAWKGAQPNRLREWQGPIAITFHTAFGDGLAFRIEQWIVTHNNVTTGKWCTDHNWCQPCDFFVTFQLISFHYRIPRSQEGSVRHILSIAGQFLENIPEGGVPIGTELFWRKPYWWNMVKRPIGNAMTEGSMIGSYGFDGICVYHIFVDVHGFLIALRKRQSPWSREWFLYMFQHVRICVECRKLND